MSLEALRKEIISSAESEAEKILSEARAKAEEILREAEERATAIVERKRQEIEARMKAALEVSIAVKRLEGKKMVYTKIMELLDKVRMESRSRLEALKNSPEYAEFWKRFLARGVEELGVKKVKVFYSTLDSEFISKNGGDIASSLKDVEVEFVDSGERFLGGFVMSDEDEKVFYVATFDGRLNDVFEKELYEVMEILRGGKA